MIRVGFLSPPNDASWLGGISYLRNLFGALVDFPDEAIEPNLLVARNTENAVPTGLDSIRRVELESLRRRSARWLGRKLLQKLRLDDRILCRELAEKGIKVLSHSGQLGNCSTVATLAWIPDFQHRHFPDLFSAAEYAEREREFGLACRNATRLIVSSEAARSDLLAFYPSGSRKCRVLRFVANVGSRTRLPSIESVRNKYGLPERYFMLPNQFWKHKNHEVVLRALVLLGRRGAVPTVAATGNTRDYRQPAHFAQLETYSRKHGLTASFRTLGIVPYDDLMSLMWNTVAFINPSRFEGWSTSVEEAKSMGKKVLLSSIPTHIEQSPPRSAYFDPDDAEALADLMEDAMNEWNPGEEHREEQLAAGELGARRRLFAETYQKYVGECVERESSV